MGHGVFFGEKPWDAHVLQQWLFILLLFMKLTQALFPISPYSTECCSDVPVPAYPPEGSPSLLHLEPQHCSDRCLSPAAHHQLFTWSALLLIRWVIWGGEESWDALKPETRKAAGKGRADHISRSREREWEFMDVGLPICTSKSWHPGGCVNLWWNHSIALMNVHTYRQHTACADSSFTDVSVLRQTGNRASSVRSEEVGGELPLAQRLHVALRFHPT